MPYRNKQMLRDANGDLIPQYWDVVEQDFKPLTGQGGANDVRLTGSNMEKGIPVQVEKDFIEVSVDTGAVDAGKDKIIDIYSEPGEMWTLKRFGYYGMRNTGSKGNQLIWIYQGESTSNTNFIMSIKGDSASFVRGAIPGRRESDAGEMNPSTEYEIIETLRDTTILSNSLPLRIRYRNNSDSTLEGASFKLFFVVERVNNIGG